MKFDVILNKCKDLFFTLEFEYCEKSWTNEDGIFILHFTFSKKISSDEARSLISFFPEEVSQWIENPSPHIPQLLKLSEQSEWPIEIILQNNMGIGSYHGNSFYVRIAGHHLNLTMDLLDLIFKDKFRSVKIEKMLGDQIRSDQDQLHNQIHSHQ